MFFSSIKELMIPKKKKIKTLMSWYFQKAYLNNFSSNFLDFGQLLKRVNAREY